MSQVNVGPKYLENSVGSRLMECTKRASIQAERGHWEAQRAMMQVSLPGTRQVHITTLNICQLFPLNPL